VLGRECDILTFERGYTGFGLTSFITILCEWGESRASGAGPRKHNIGPSSSSSSPSGSERSFGLCEVADD
jgi:hypothetical protein